jgi:hypothetical protein
MTQVLGIFRKDARGLRVEIALSLAIAAALVWVIPMQWNGPVETLWGAANHRMMELEMMTRALSVLLVLSWGVLIVRAVHAEALVGDRQFWVTRPYAWTSLLAAKALFVAAFVVAPLLAMQCAVLLRAGMNPLASVSGLVFNLVLIVGILLAPMMAIAAVTADFTKMALTLLAVLVGAAVLVFKVTMHGSFPAGFSWPARLVFLSMGYPFMQSGAQTGGGHDTQLAIALLLMAVSAAAVVVQYARRRTAISRGILLALPVALTVLVLATAHGSSTAAGFSDPTYVALRAGETPPVELAFAPSGVHQFYLSRGDYPLGVRIPLRVSGIAADRAVIAGAYPRVTFTGADGYVWTTNTIEFYPEKFMPGTQWTRDGFTIPQPVYDRLKTGPVTIRLSFAETELQATTQERLKMPLENANVAGYGACGRRYAKQAMISCLTALKAPPLTYASADWQDGPCATGQTELQQVRGDYWAGMVDADPAEFGISPVLGTAFSFMPDWNNATGGKVLCSGSMITLTQYRVVRRVQTETVIRGFVLPED